MAITNAGKTRACKLISDDIDYVTLGTDESNFNTGDTALGAEITATQRAPEVIQNGQSFTSTHTMVATTGNGNTYNESGIVLNDGTMLDRTVFPDIQKNDDVEIITVNHIRVS